MCTCEGETMPGFCRIRSENRTQTRKRTRNGNTCYGKISRLEIGSPTWMLCVIVMLFSIGSCDGQSTPIPLTLRVDEGVSGEIGSLNLPQAAPSYQILSDTDSLFERDFVLNLNSGAITVKNGIILDRERTEQYVISVLSLSTFNALIVTIRINDINDNSPVFNQPILQQVLSENAPPRETIVSLGTATDNDAGQNGVQSFQIISGNTGGTWRLQSKLHNGILYADLYLNQALDYEDPSMRHYTIIVRAFDGGSPRRYGDLTVNITVLDNNDNTPIFVMSLYHAEVYDNATVGSSVMQVSATDQDSGENAVIHYSIERPTGTSAASGDDRIDKFSIDSEGVITVNSVLEYDPARPTVSLTVKASNPASQGEQSSSCVVEITILHIINRQKPNINLLWLTDDGTPKVPETAQPGEFVARVSVNDPDGDQDLKLVNVSLSGGDGHFGLQSSGNFIYIIVVQLPPDRETRAVYTITITAMDAGSPPLITTQVFDIEVGDYNDNAPQFTQSIYHGYIQEIVSPGASVVQVSATDLDAGNNSVVTYSIIPTPNTFSHWFQINEQTGLITTAAKIDCETASQPQLTVQARDNGEPQLSSTASVVVDILDINDNQPVFDQSFYNVSVYENVPVQSCVLKVSASDPDCGVNAQVTYAIASNLGLEYPTEFFIKNHTGDICVLHSLDFETKNEYEFWVVARDLDGLDTTAMIKIKLLDVNDNRPVFYPLTYSVNLSEDSSPGSTVAIIRATDADQGANSRVTYSIESGNNNGYFSIGTASGQIKLENRLPSGVSVHTLHVQASDGGGLTSSVSAEVKISIIDNNQQAPQFEFSKYDFTVREDATEGHVLGTVKATNSDSGAGAIIYSITSGDPSNYFTINPTSGVVTTNSKVDHEVYASLFLNILAASGSPPTYGQAQLNITIEDINDNSPNFKISNIAINIREDTDTLTTIYQAHATDLDSGDYGHVRYSLSSNPHQRLSINELTGAVKLTSTVDYELKKNYSVVILAQDGGNPPRSSQLRVVINIQDVNDNVPRFTQPVFKFDVSEGAQPSTKFGQVSATDLDSGNNARITYSLKPNADSEKFAIFTNDGYIYNKDTLDREDQEKYTFQVVATDNGIPMQSALVEVVITVIDVNNKNPTFSQTTYMFTLLENQPSGTIIGQVTATDADKGENARLTFELVSSSTIFEIQSSTGVINSLRQFDREAGLTEYEFTIKATDHGPSPRSDTANVKVTILDMNDNPPVFQQSGSYKASVEENKAKGTNVIKVSATDPDVGMNGTVSYYLKPGVSGNEKFNINAQSGWVTTKEVLDRETQGSYTLLVVARDKGAPRKSSSATVQVTITDVNEPPSFPTAFVSFTVKEGSTPGTIVGQVQANDNDQGMNAKITYYLVSGNLFGTFGLNRATGEIYVAQPVDYEMSSGYQMRVHAVDNSAINQQSTYVNINITIIDVNDNRPKFTQDPVILGLNEGVTIGKEVYTFTATDSDSGVNSHLKYSIVSQSPNTASYFTLDVNTGKLTTAREIDAETVQQILLIVQAEDQALDVTARKSTRVTTILSINDLNDNPPVFQSRDTISVMEDEPVNYPVIHVIARDADRLENGRVTYDIVSGNEALKFSLNTNTGLLSLISMLDREVNAQYKLTIMASDQGTPRKSSQQVLTINVMDINDNAPHFVHSAYKVTVTENQPPGIPVATVVATDSDAGNNSNLTYLIPDGTADGMFKINAQSGEITTEDQLDREHTESYILTVYVHDNGYPAQYDSATVIVTVLDTNDHTPMFVQSLYSLVVPENSASVSVIHSVVATDADIGVNGNITYSIIAGNVGGKFLMNSQTGQLSVGALDREVLAQYNLTIQAIDHGANPMSSTCMVMVTVEDLNDNDPVFTQEVYQKNIYENIAIGSSVMRIQATDNDELGNNSKITYSLNNRTFGMFKIDNETGLINTTGTFDREKVGSYQFEVRASDSGLYDRRKSVKLITINILDVNDNAPYFTMIPFSANVTVTTQTTTEIVQLIAQDKDQGINSQIEYRFKNPNGDQERYYTIENSQNKGHVKLTRVLAVDGGNIHRMEIEAYDKGVPSLTSTGWLVVRVGDNPGISTLRFDKLTYSVYVSEEATANTEVARVSAQYAQAGDGQNAINYNFAGGNEDRIFHIDYNSGVITINDRTKLDYETTQRLRLIVVASSMTAIGYTTVWVNLRDANDNAPYFAQDRYTSSVYEGNSRGTYVTQVSASDADSGENARINYIIISGNNAGAFDIVPPHSGIVTTSKVLDREIQASYKLEIMAQDSGNPQQSSTCTLRITVVDVNDNEPFIPDLRPVRVNEGTDVGTIITTVTATDADTNPTLTYDFATNGNPGDTFSIDRFSGRLSLAKSVDHEHKNVYHLMITASDTVHETTANLTVNIVDVNDNAPVFMQSAYQVDLPELTAAGYPVVTVNATDADSGLNGAITYSIVPRVQGSDGFYIQPLTGKIYTNKTVAYTSSQPNVQLVITAKDKGTPSLNSVVAVRIRITDINNFSPLFGQNPYSAHVSEDEDTGKTVTRVTATDRDDSTQNSRVDYSISSGNSDNKFEMIPNTGEIILTGNLDRETKSLYTLSVKAADRGVPPKESTTTVLIYVDDINDWAPQFNQTSYSVSVNESIAPGSAIIQVFATDKDVGIHQEIEYAITSGNEDGMFIINEITGLISIPSSKQVDHDTTSLYKLIVRARDTNVQGKERLSAYATVNVNVTDINDNGPIFPVLMYLEDVPENAPVPTSVFTAHANDNDKGIYGAVEYQITENNQYFLIDRKTGVVTTNVIFDYETKNDYQFEIMATDLGARQQVIKARVTIQSVDEYKPKFVRDNYSFDVRGDAAVGDVVGTVEATDQDQGDDGVVLYTIVADQTNSEKYFTIGQTSGILTVAQSLKEEVSRRRRSIMRRELPSDFSLIIKAGSGKNGSKTETIVCKITADYSCEGCSPTGQGTTTVGTGPSTAFVLEGTPLILVIVFAIVAVVLVVVIVVMWMRSRRNNKRTADPPQPHFDEGFDVIDIPPARDEGPPMYNDIGRGYSPQQHNRSEMSDQSHSASSGRGSAEFIPEDDDEELRIINSAPLMQSQNMTRKAMPDSGIQQDHDNISDSGSVQNHQEYLARLGIDASKIKTDSKPKGLARSVESMHHFSDEGGGEGDGLDIGVLVEQKLGEVEADEAMAIMDGTREFGFGDTEPSHAGSLSSVINSEEEFSGSYNWDYLLDWGPQYQPLAHVFSEIARLKDETIQPKKQPIRTVPQVHIPNSLKPQLKTRPPPIITNVPPKANPIQIGSTSNLSSGSGMNSTRTSQLVSLPSLPKSPISYESSFTSPALSPSFTPTLSPLATRSPSISPLQTPGASQSGRTSGHSTPRSKKSRTRNLAMAASSESEQELRI